MQAFVAYEKLSKKKQKQLNAAKRRTWGDVKPVTKVKASAKIYNRKQKNLMGCRDDYSSGSFGYRSNKFWEFCEEAYLFKRILFAA